MGIYRAAMILDETSIKSWYQYNLQYNLQSVYNLQFIGVGLEVGVGVGVGVGSGSG